MWGIGYSSGCTLIDVNYRDHVVEAELTPPLVASPSVLYDEMGDWDPGRGCLGV